MPRVVRDVTLMILLLAAPAVSAAQSQMPPPAVPTDDPLDFDERIRARDVASVLRASFRLAMLEHMTRVAFESGTRAELGGPFWRDYHRSVRMPKQWDDTDSWLVNYVGHPIHGAGAGMIWLDHSDDDRQARLFGPGYLSSRAKATAFSAFYSLQFEIGPLSEASIGNVGLRPETVGWVDHVVTPIGGFGFMIAEEALDRYVVRWIESKTRNRVLRAAVRLAFGPSRMLANTAQNRLPWHRPDRALDTR